MKLDGAAWERWAKAITHIKSDLQSTVNDRAVFRGFSDLVHQNEEWIAAHDGMFFCNFVARAYVASVALGIRRHVKPHDDALSLIRVLSQLKDCAPQLTFEFYSSRFPRELDDFPSQEPTFRFVSHDGKVASAALIDQDIRELNRLTFGVESYVDRTLAHLDRRGFDGNVTFNDLDDAVDALDKIACKYICLLTGGSPDSLERTLQFDWRRIFSVPFCARTSSQ